MLSDFRPAEEADLLTAAFDRFPDGMLIFDGEDHLALWNRRASVLAPDLPLVRGRRRQDVADDLRRLETADLLILWPPSASGVRVCLIRGPALPSEQLQSAKLSLERAVRAQARYLAVASHDLRQPLQALAMLVGILADGPQGAAEAGIVGKISEAVAALESHLGNLLEISRLEAGLVEPAITDFPLAPLFGGLAMEFHQQATDLGLRLHVIPGSVWVSSDPLLLERILRQLLANAVQNTGRGGVLLGCRRRGSLIRIEVRDSGIGIPEAEWHLLFRDFHHSSRQLPGRRRGLGLGLAIVGRLARMLGHQIGYSASPGGGSLFTLALRCAADAESRRMRSGSASRELCGDSPADTVK